VELVPNDGGGEQRRAPTREGGESARERLIDAMVEEAGRKGYDSVTVEMVMDRAGVSREGFDKEFDGKDDCFFAAFDSLIAVFTKRCMEAYARPGEWADKLRATAQEFLDYLVQDPPAGRVLCLEILHAGRKGAARRDMYVRIFASIVDAGRQELDDPESLPYAIAEGITGAVYETVYSNLARGQEEALPDLMPQMMCMAVMPYLGVEAALEELEK
jgi:AcrR family transcriptional regulator